MASQTALSDFQHQPLIEALTNFFSLPNFFSLLAETCYIQTSDILLPPHGANFNPSLGAAEGFSPSALTILSQLPYLSEQCQTISLDGGSTNPLSYLTDPLPDEGGGLSRGSWPDARDPTCLGEEEMKLPEHMVAITLGNLYGTWLIYDLESRTLRAWDTIAAEVDSAADFEKLPALAPAEMLEQWAARFRALEFMPLEFYGSVFKPAEQEDLMPEEADLVAEWNEGVGAEFGITRNEYVVARGLEKLYRQYGWRGGSGNGDGDGYGWQREEFVASRQVWFAGVYAGRDERRPA